MCRNLEISRSARARRLGPVLQYARRGRLQAEDPLDILDRLLDWSRILCITQRDLRLHCGAAHLRGHQGQDYHDVGW